PDGRTLAVTTTRGEQGKLLLFDVPARKLRKTLLFGEKAHVSNMAFSPDGKWIAVPTQVMPDVPRGTELTPDDFPQPRLHLVEAATGAVRETMTLPQGFTRSVCFSPDGKTLAAGGYGRVLLLDLAKPPLETAPGAK